MTSTRTTARPVPPVWLPGVYMQPSIQPRYRVSLVAVGAELRKEWDGMPRFLPRPDESAYG